MNAVAVELVDLLGGTRADIVDVLRNRPGSVADLAVALDLSEAAIRRHIQVLERDGLVSAQTVRRDGPGRPSAHYALTDKAMRLFPDRSAEIANELLEFVEAQYGRSAYLQFLRWRQERQGARYAAALRVGAPDGLPAERAELLAELLSEDGFMAEAGEATLPEGATVLQLRQRHCAVKEIAEAHPEVCAYEAALFQRLLGAKVSRRSTIAGGAGECVCTITPQPAEANLAGTEEERQATTATPRMRSN